MRRIFALLIAAMVGLPLAAAAAEDKAYIAFEAMTSSQVMVGMPKIELPPGIELPPEVAAMMGGGATRTLNVRLWSPQTAPAGAEATVLAPGGLKQGPRLNLELRRPKPEEPGVTRDDEGGEGTEEPTTPDYTIKIYWGSSKTVRPGQPKVIRLADLGVEERAESERLMRARMAAKPDVENEDWTEAVWPNKAQPGKIAGDALLEGDYTINSSYAGNTSLAVPEEVRFLDPFTLLSPETEVLPDLTEFIDLAWQPIASLLGARAQMFGMEGHNTLILWSSSELEDDGAASGGWLSMAQVRELVEQKIFLAPETTQVFIPAGIFANTDMQSLTLTGWGRGVANDEGEPRARMQTRVDLTMSFIDMGNDGGEGDAGDAEDGGDEE